jgi:hypothetical protein
VAFLKFPTKIHDVRTQLFVLWLDLGEVRWYQLVVSGIIDSVVDEEQDAGIGHDPSLDRIENSLEFVDPALGVALVTLMILTCDFPIQDRVERSRMAVG